MRRRDRLAARLRRTRLPIGLEDCTSPAARFILTRPSTRRRYRISASLRSWSAMRLPLSCDRRLTRATISCRVAALAVTGFPVSRTSETAGKLFSASTESHSATALFARNSPESVSNGTGPAGAPFRAGTLRVSACSRRDAAAQAREVRQSLHLPPLFEVVLLQIQRAKTLESRSRARPSPSPSVAMPQSARLSSRSVGHFRGDGGGVRPRAPPTCSGGARRVEETATATGRTPGPRARTPLRSRSVSAGNPPRTVPPRTNMSSGYRPGRGREPEPR